jgi:PIN domain nuclease of toxin-antitoxin system
VKVLLDTAVFWWLAIGSPRLSRRAAELFADSANDVALSPVSIWELLVKNQIGKLPTPVPIADLLTRVREERLVRSLPLRDSAVLRLASLPPLHRDPFDRMLICQALDEGMTLVTPDERIRAYPVSTVWE